MGLWAMGRLGDWECDEARAVDGFALLAEAYSSWSWTVGRLAIGRGLVAG